MSDILVIPDQHADPRYDNVRFDYLSALVGDLRPDVVVNLGDAADMASLASYDRGKRSFYGRSYQADINSHLEGQARLWDPVKAKKKKMPRRIVLEGNHEHRIERALDLSPELEGTMSFHDFKFHEYYDDIVRYEGGTPGTIEVSGITFGHYLTSGVMGRPISGEHHAYSLIAKQLSSCVVGHSHCVDYAVRTNTRGDMVQGLVAGCFFDYETPWAGVQVNKLYWRGVVLLKNVENGTYDPEFISLRSLQREYGNGGR